MKKLALLVCTVFVAALVVAQVSPLLAAAKTHNLTAEVVSVDIEGKTLTIKDDKGETKTAAVLGKAVDSLKSLKAGEMVRLTCQDNEKGEHQGISAIKIEKAEKKS